jgi:hypothetical protein
MDAINYSSAFGAGGVNPMQAFNQSLALGSNIMQQRAAAAQAEAQRIAAQAEAERQAKLAEMMGTLDSPNATADDYRRVAVYMNPEQAKVMKDFYTEMADEERETALSEYGQVLSAFEGGRPDVGIELLKMQAKAAPDDQSRAFGNMLVQMAESGEMGIDAIKKTINTHLSFMPGGDKVLDSVQQAQKAPAELMVKEAEGKYADARQAAELRKLDAETLKLLTEAEKEKLPQGTEIDESARKIMNTAVEAAISSDLTANQATNLADAYAKYKPASGWTANAWEAAKKASGGEDIQTRLKQEYTKLRNTDVLKNLPPGVASDKDIEIALAAFPSETANPDTIISFLRGMSKLQAYSSEVNKSKAEWVNQNGSLGPARLDFTAGGKQVKKGQAFWDFTKDIPMPNVVGGTTAKAATTGAAEKPGADTKPAVKVDF